MKLLPSLKRPTIADAWARTSKLPFGNRVFSRLIGRMAPYSGSVGATILDLSDGYCRAELRERPEIRNHLRSIHAVALINLGELATGLLYLDPLPHDLHENLKTVKTPLNRLGEADLCPGSAALDQINAALR